MCCGWCVAPGEVSIEDLEEFCVTWFGARAMYLMTVRVCLRLGDGGGCTRAICWVTNCLNCCVPCICDDNAALAGQSDNSDFCMWVWFVPLIIYVAYWKCTKVFLTCHTLICPYSLSVLLDITRASQKPKDAAVTPFTLCPGSIECEPLIHDDNGRSISALGWKDGMNEANLVVQPDNNCAHVVNLRRWTRCGVPGSTLAVHAIRTTQLAIRADIPRRVPAPIITNTQTTIVMNKNIICACLALHSGESTSRCMVSIDALGTW